MEAWCILTSAYCLAIIVVDQALSIYNKRCEEEASKNLFALTESEALARWVFYTKANTDHARAKEAILKFTNMTNNLEPIQLSFYQTYFDNTVSLIALLFLFTVLFFAFLYINKNLNSNYVKKLENFKKEIYNSSSFFKKNNAKLFNAHVILIEKLDLLAKTDFLKFSDYSQFNEINSEIQLFYDLMKSENEHTVLLYINNFKQMLHDIVLGNVVLKLRNDKNNDNDGLLNIKK